MKKLFFKKINKAHSGYTIIETMIAVALFLIVITISMGSLLNANAVHEKSRKMRSIMDSLSFAMEDMSRNLRTGYKYRCITVDPDVDLPVVATPKSGPSCWGIAFESDLGTSSSSDQWVYYISNTGKIFKLTQGPYTFSSPPFVQLTPDEIIIDTAKSSFSVLGAEPPESPLSSTEQQPFVTIKLVGKIILKDNTETPFSLQTSVSQRLVDI